jgi:hypothetical protein
MSVKSAVIGIVLAAFASQAIADIPDGKGGRTSPQASTQTTVSAARKCCEKTVAGNCKQLVVNEATTIEPRVPPQRTTVVATPLRCKHMLADTTGAIEPRVPPQRAATAAPTAPRHACCENARCKHVG